MTIVKSGTWFYGEAVPKPVDIIGLPYDFWYELAVADDQLEPGEEPTELNELGLLYYVRFRNAGQTTDRTWPDSPRYQTVGEAMTAAQDRAPTAITWS